MAAVLLGVAHRPAPLIVYSAPAGDRPAGANRLHPTDAILPNGRIAAPSGKSILVGTDPLGMALTPDGRYAIVSNDSQSTGGLVIPPSDPPLEIGYSLAVIDTRTMHLASIYRDPSAAFFMGVAAVHDPADPSRTIVLASDAGSGSVRVFDLTDGQLTPRLAIALPPDGLTHAVPAGIAVDPGASVAYVVDNLGDSVVAVDLRTEKVVRSIPVGDFPFNVAVDAQHVLVSGMGLSSYGAVSPAPPNPTFAAPAFDPLKSSTLSVLALSDAGDGGGDPSIVRMDPQPDGSENVGGADPGAIVISRDGKSAYVALSNVDRVAVVSLEGEPRVVRGLDLRLYPDAPYGAQPSAEALSNDGKRLYVALAGLNAVAVVDALSPERYRYGLIPTGWYPTSLALSPNGRYLYVVSTKGVDGWGIFQKIDLKKISLVKATLATLRYNRTPKRARFDAVIPPLRSNKRSDVIDRVVYISVGTNSYDAVLGDLKDASGAPHGNGEPALALYPESVTPNIHALARTYALADNLYAADDNLDLARQSAMAADPPLYSTLVANVGSARAPLNGGVDPENYERSGYLFNALARAGISYRDYGGLLQLSGYRDALYHLDVPALAALSGNVDLAYAGWNERVDDAARAKEFVHDMQRYVDADAMPSFTYVWLPTLPGNGGIAGADRALGTIVAYLSHTPHWSSTAIFVVPEGVQLGSIDHVNAFRSYAIVVSPLAKRGYVGNEHLSVSSVLKTEEEIFGLPPLGLGDLLAGDLAAFFGTVPDPQPYEAIR